MPRDKSEALRQMVFRPERSRPVWRNKHTGTEVTVLDLAVNDHGGFQGGCRQFVVVTDDPGPPGPQAPPSPQDRGPTGAGVQPLWTFLDNWEPTGRHVDYSEPAKLQKASTDEYRREANAYRRELEGIGRTVARVLDEGTAS